MTRRVYVRGLPTRTRLLTEGSLVLIRTNGNRSRIGNVYRVPTLAVGHAYSAFQFGLFPRHANDSSYLFWYLSSPDVQRLISEAASGTTGLGNVAVSWLKQLPVPWPDPITRFDVAATADAIATAADAAGEVGLRQERLRGQLLAKLLSGQHAIPDSYDRFLDTAS